MEEEKQKKWNKAVDGRGVYQKSLVNPTGADSPDDSSCVKFNFLEGGCARKIESSEESSEESSRFRDIVRLPGGWRECD